MMVQYEKWKKLGKSLHSKFGKYRYVLSLHCHISKTATGILTKIGQDLHVVEWYNILKIC